MKPIFFTFAIFISTLGLLLTGCSSSSKDDGGVPSVGKITMTVDGSKWEATGANGLRTQAGNNQQLSIAGTHLIDLSTNTMDIVTIAFLSNSPLEEGDYIHRDGLPFVQITFNKGDTSPQNTYFSKEATVTITKLEDSSIQGVFSGVLAKDNSPDITITDGGFNVNIMQP